MKTTLKDWVTSGQSINDLRQLNYNMSYVLKELNKNDVYVKTFNPREISFDDQNLYPIEFSSIDVSNDIAKDRDNNIYNLSFLFVGLYSDMLDILKPEFLKENFEQFKPFLPPEDVSYFNGIVTKEYRVYYNDYIDEIKKQQANQQTDAKNSRTSSNSKAQTNLKKLTKSTAVGRAYAALYEQNGAFVSYLIIPIIFAVIAIVVGLILLFAT